MIEPQDLQRKVNLFKRSPQKPIYKQNLLMDHEEPQYIIDNYKNSYLKIGGNGDGLDNSGNTNIMPLAANAKSIPMRTDTDGLILANAFYIFMTIIVLLILLSAISFGIREYSFAFRRRIKSSTSEALKLNNWNNTNKKANRPLPLCNKIDKAQVREATNTETNNQHETPMSSKNNAISGMTQFTDKEPKIENAQQWCYKEDTSPNYNMPSSHTESEKVYYENEYDSGLTDKSITKFTKKQTIPSFVTIQPKPIYSIDSLMTLDKTKAMIGGVLNNVFKYKQKQKIPMSCLLNCTIVLPRTTFDNAWKAAKVIRDAENEIITSSCEISKKLLLLRILSIGKSFELLDNPNIFLEAFNDCIENLVDMGLVFTMMFDSSVVLKLLLIESLLTYSWSHYRFYDFDAKSNLVKLQFSNWNLPHPIVQTRNTIFKILCNLQLGLDTIFGESKEMENDNELKLGLVIRESINHSVCNDYIGYVPMIAQAIDISNIDRNKFFFYEILKLLIVKHGNCCMKEYIQESNIELKTLVQYGLSDDQHLVIQDKAKEIFQLLSRHDENIFMWFNDINHSKIHIDSAVPLSTEHTEKYFSAPLFKQQPPILEEPSSGSTFDSFSHSWKMGILSSDLKFHKNIDNRQSRVVDF